MYNSHQLINLVTGNHFCILLELSSSCFGAIFAFHVNFNFCRSTNPYLFNVIIFVFLDFSGWYGAINYVCEWKHVLSSSFLWSTSKNNLIIFEFVPFVPLTIQMLAPFILVFLFPLKGWFIQWKDTVQMLF
jgi:hypothetical protein